MRDGLGRGGRCRCGCGRFGQRGFGCRHRVKRGGRHVCGGRQGRAIGGKGRLLGGAIL
ncbi:SWIM zinc finger family protein [Pseudosulfitobacter pseudonitzschiae]|uniref:SWIM zinc finger family protein n=1 Tax=Pseudosulfitobacter pseudonitzschiae TaxID=1402135 RepID=UPI001CCA187C|nr:SWIM zinc finger family protein [Pseudosulfitobacter pseudonitzschiae]